MPFCNMLDSCSFTHLKLVILFVLLFAVAVIPVKQFAMVQWCHSVVMIR